MTSGWREMTLGEVVELKRGHDLPSHERRAGNVPVVSSSGISGTHDVAKVAAPGVVTGRYGSIGQVFYIENDFWPLNTTLYVKDFKGNDPLFISYFLRTLDFASCSDKAAVPGVNRNHLHMMRVRVPSVADQRAIARILGALDEKIELNRRMNETLEFMARAIFKSWFVDFDPVRAKAEGRQPAGMDAETAALFPDSLEDSPLGKIPAGWTAAPLGEHVEVVRGLSYQGAHLVDEGMPLHNLNSVLEGGGYKHDGIKFYAGEYQDRHTVRPGDLVVANTEQGFQFLLIGCAALIPRQYGDTGIFSHHLYRLRARSGSSLTPGFVHFLLLTQRMRDEVVGYTNGTTVNMLPADGLERPLVAVPSHALVQRFQEVVGPMIERTENLRRESELLAAMRDALLPKLLSGQLETQLLVGRH